VHSGAKISLVARIALLLTVQVCTAGAEDWPSFLGPHANGISDETGLIDRFSSNGPPLKWSQTLGTGYGAPSVAKNILVVHHRKANEEIVEAFNPANGTSLWHYSYPSHFVDPYGYNNGPRGTPLLHSNRCYTFGAEGMIACLDLSTGKKLWDLNSASRWEVPPAFFGVGSSPVMEGGNLIVMVGGQTNSGLVALDPATGKTIWESVGQKNWEGQPMYGWRGEPPVKWQSWEKQASYSTPIAATIHSRRHLLALTRQGLVSMNPTNGNPNFSFWFRSPANDSVNAMTPIVSDDLIFISAAYYKIGSVLLRVARDGKSVKPVWRGISMEMHWSTPILHKGFLYGFSGRNEPDPHFRCIELLTGKVMWERDETWQPHSSPTPQVFGRGSCLVADGKLFCLGEGGLFGIFKPSPEQCVEVSRFQVRALHYPCWAAPVLANGLIYLRSEDHLVCLDILQRN
jgi:outer membrane protein assembly factor BamB